jgi:uncharacterized protein (TIGR00725 family)
MIKATNIAHVCWILDHDKRLGALVKGNREIRNDEVLLERIQEAAQAGNNILLGVDTECPPLPCAYVLRTQLVDLYHTLHALAREGPDSSAHVAMHKFQFPDYYHDVAANTGRHLEAPFEYPAPPDARTTAEMLTGLSADLGRVLLGDAVSRPLLASEDVVLGRQDIPAVPSILRGGSTFVLQPDALLEVANFAPTINGHQSRRSDMVWACLNSRLFGRPSYLARALTVRHVRRDDKLPSRDSLIKAVVDDIWGAGVYRALDYHLAQASDVAFSEADIAAILASIEQHAQDRASAMIASLYRIHGLIGCISNIMTAEDAWWHGSEAARNIRQQLVAARELYELQTWVPRLTKGLEATNSVRSELASWLLSLGTELQGLRSRKEGLCKHFEQFFADHRSTNARVNVARLLAIGPTVSSDLVLIGSGQEGVVFHHPGSGVALKYMDWYGLRADEGHLDFLRERFGARTGATFQAPHPQAPPQVLPHSLRIIKSGLHVVIERPFIEGQEFFAGARTLGWDFCLLVRECRALGVVCNNICPQNLIISTDESGEHLHLVDIGTDIVSWSASGEEAMMKRAFLTYTWAHRVDLKTVLRRSRTENINTLPELCGFEAFRSATDQSEWQAENDLYELVLEAVRGLGRPPERVLDFGCGKGGKLLLLLNDKLSLQTTQLLGYDPMVHDWPASTSPSPRMGFVSDREKVLCEAPFDLIICARVVCCVKDLPEVRSVLDDLQRAASSHADILIAICHPLFVEGGSDSAHQERLVDGDFDGRCVGSWEKHVRTTGHTRKEHFLPLHVLKRELLRAGFYMHALSETSTVDVHRFLPSSDYLLVHARLSPKIPKTLANQGARDAAPRASLVIRTCSMEWRTLYPSVIHLSSTLEGPHVFFERVLLVDSRKEDFLRQHDQGNVAAFDKAVEQLLREGWIDKVHRANSAPEVVCDLYQRWFGLDSASTHAQNKAPVTSSLEAFEVCSGDLILLVDSDIMVRRQDPLHEYLADACTAFARSHSCLTWSLNICQDSLRPIRFVDEKNGSPFRVEVRASVWHRARLLSSRPLQTVAEDWGDVVPPTGLAECVGKRVPLVGWYRLFDHALPPGASARGGGTGTFFVHPQNDPIKADPGNHLLFLDCVEKGRIPLAIQAQHVDLEGDLMRDWIAENPSFLNRSEDIVFIVCGHNVSPPKWRRCLQSLQRQSYRNWGAVFVDDGSRPDWAEDMQIVLQKEERVTLVQPRICRGSMANHILAIRYICTNPRSIIAMLDMDDCLIGSEAIAKVLEEYARGADLTVGSMLRTDKTAPCPYPVTFSSSPCGARGSRGAGNVWQHLRTFRRYLFLRICDGDLRNDQGRYFERATDWAFMLPMVEMAIRPVHLHSVLYLYEPSRDQHAKRCEREANATVIVQRSSYSKLRIKVAIVGDARLGSSPIDRQKHEIAFELGQRLAENGCLILTGGLGGIMEAACRGAKVAVPREVVTVGLLPGTSSLSANSFVDISIPTGLEHGRNALVARADIVVAVGGGAGTQSEISLAWSQKRVVIAFVIPGDPLSASSLCAGQVLDHRTRFKTAHARPLLPGSEAAEEEDCVLAVHSVDEVLEIVSRFTATFSRDKVGAREGEI